MPLNPVNGSPGSEIIHGTAFGDLIRAGGGADTVQGLAGNDVIHGQGGGDELFGNEGRDRIFGGAGDDFITGGAGEDWLYGDDGNDYIAAGVFDNDSDENHAFGGAGDDTIEFFLIQRGNGEADGGDGTDTLQLGPFAFTREVDTPLHVTLSGPGAGVSYDSDHGESVTISLTSIEALILSSSFGDDVINTHASGDYTDYVRAGDGANTVNTYGGNDFISYIHREPGQVNTIDGGTGIDNLRVDVGVWAFEDPSITFTVTGTTATDNFGAVISNVENYQIYAVDGDDTVIFGAGNDTFYGANGDDEATGNDGDDLLHGDGGSDRLFGNLGDDSLNGGDANDTLNGGGGDDLLIGGDGSDRIVGGSGHDEIFTGQQFNFFVITGPEYVDAGDGDDRVWAYAQSGSTLLGGDGLDTLILVTLGAPGPLVLDLTGAGPSDILVSGFESVSLQTGGFDDHITGTQFSDFMNVSAGRNTVLAGDGDDNIWAHYGADQNLDGGDGEDALNLGVLPNGAGAGLVFEVNGTAASDNFGSSYTGFERYDISGDVAGDSITLGAGDDKGVGRKGDDTIDGGAGNDVLAGGWGDDKLAGGDGDDILVGYKGMDTLTGGAGADRFRFSWLQGETADLITDFETGVDRLVISRFYTDPTLAALLPKGILDPAHFALGAAVGGSGQFVYVTDASGGHLLWDADGSGAGAGVEIATLEGAPLMSAGDIQLF